ncbi:antibiotic biosynthesis monooxygenase [Leptolyngbya sp. FACHB-16]|nr:antibiotic biosynthesis monooxygenase [Leptolyngbya sp. FACHB-16]
MLEPLALGTDKETQQVTAIISHMVRPGRELGYEEWLHGITTAAQKFKGYLGVNVIRPWDHVHPEYVAIVKFDQYSNLKAWMESTIRKEWMARLQPMLEKPEAIQTLTGLETWFMLPNRLKVPPPRHKMVLVTWVGVFLTQTIPIRVLSPLLSEFPIFLKQLISTGFSVLLLTYIIMPRLTKLFYKWLYPSP